MSLASLIGLSAALHFYVGIRLVPSLPGPVSSSLLSLLLLASSVLTPLGLVARRVAKPPAADRLAWAGLLFMGLFSSLFVFTVLRDAVLLVAALAGMALPELGLDWADVFPDAEGE